MNEDGITIDLLVDDLFEVYPTPQIIKQLWKNIQTRMYGDTSTTELTTEKINKIYDVFNKKLSEQFGIYVPWPCQESIADAQLYEN